MFICRFFFPKLFAVIFLVNGLLLLTILLARSFRQRKEMLIIAGMASADLLYGLGNVLLCIYRVYLLSHGEANDKITAWECISRSPLFFVNFALQLTALMNVVVSGDRLLAVAWPYKYHKRDQRYAMKTIVGVSRVNDKVPSPDKESRSKSQFLPLHLSVFYSFLYKHCVSGTGRSLLYNFNSGHVSLNVFGHGFFHRSSLHKAVFEYACYGPHTSYINQHWSL